MYIKKLYGIQKIILNVEKKILFSLCFIKESRDLLGMPGLVCPCMHLFSDWLLSLKLANALVKQSAETIDHCMWQRQGVCVCVSRGVGGGRKKEG